MTYEVVWSGSLDRLGACKSLTGYRGASSLLNAPPDISLDTDELSQAKIALGIGRARPRRGTPQLLPVRGEE